MSRLPQHRPPTHPGAMFREEFVDPLHLSSADLTRRLALGPVELEQLLIGAHRVDRALAARLQEVTGMPMTFWLDLQEDWERWHAQRRG